MKKVSFLMILCMFLITNFSNAQQRVSKEEVKNVAINTLYKKADILKRTSNTDIDTIHSFSNDKNDVLMYEVVFENGSAVLLSGSKTCQPVLGYYTKEDKGSIFDTNDIDIPPGLRALLEDYAERIELCFAQDSIELYYESEWNTLQRPSLQKSHSPVDPVGPLLKTKWGQKVANNVGCPAYNYYVTETSTNQCSDCSNRCPLGCNAVAMGQVMKHWNYPVYLPNREEQFDWCNMPEGLYTYLPPDYDEKNLNYEKERNAIARLLKDCADAANTNYCVGNCASSALLFNVRDALVDSFGYSSEADRRDRSSYNDNNWKNFIKEDLDNGRPVIYGSLGTWFDGHTWVCDGYDSEDYFHMNWGWSKSSSLNGWYTLNEIKDINGHNYRWSQRAIFKVYPSTNENYCDYTFSLDDHFAAGWTHQSVPKTFMKLVSASETSPFAWRTIQSGYSAEYVAHESVKLLPGFKAEAGSTFLAFIVPCRLGCENTNQSILSAVSNTEINKENNDTTPLSVKYLQKGVKGKEISLSPNPNTGTFTLNTNIDPQEIISIKVLTPLGLLLYEQAGLSNNTIQLPSSAKGLFFVEIQTTTQRFVRKMVVH